MLVVIVGAGATADGVSPSQFGQDARPPLTDDLVGRDRYQGTVLRWDPVGILIGRLRDRLDQAKSDERQTSLESELTAIYEASYSKSESLRRQLVAFRFYAQEIMQGVSEGWQNLHHGDLNADWLVSSLGEWQLDTKEHVSYVSFNYDTVLDEALARYYRWSWYRGDTSLSLVKYVETSRAFRLYKPHGSWNWAQPASIQRSEPTTIYDAFEAMMSSEYEFEFGPAALYPSAGGLKPRTEFSFVRVGEREYHPTAPALSLPLSSKTRMVMPGDHSARMESDLAAASGVVAIGWHVGEEYFRKLLADKLSPGTKLILVSPRAVPNAERVKGELPGIEIWPFGMGFAEFHTRNQLTDALRVIYG